MATIEQPLDLEKLQQFVFRAVDEVGATLNTALVVMGDKLGLYREMARRRAAHAGRARRAHRLRRAVRARVVERAGGRRLRGVRSRFRPVCPSARAGDRAHGRGEPGVPARLLPARARVGQRLAADRRGGPHRRGRRLARPRARLSTRVASASSARATTRTSSRRGCPRSPASWRSSSGARASRTSAAGTAPRRS